MTLPVRAALFALVLVVACESDAAKLDRLRGDAAIARLHERRLRDDVARTGGRALEDSLSAAVTDRMLAERALNRFMEGR